MRFIVEVDGIDGFDEDDMDGVVHDGLTETWGWLVFADGTVTYGVEEITDAGN